MLGPVLVLPCLESCGLAFIHCVVQVREVYVTRRDLLHVTFEQICHVPAHALSHHHIRRF